MSLESGNGRLSFFQQDLTQPCEGCSAPCCTMLVLPHPAPVRWMDFDFLRYALGFPGMEALLYEDGRWSLVVHRECRNFDARTRRCNVHGTPEQPRTCVYYSPHHCWYKRNFNEAESVDVLRLDQTRLDCLLRLIEFAPDGQMVSWPGWPAVRDALAAVAAESAPVQRVAP
jgi:hypothetical protein